MKLLGEGPIIEKNKNGDNVSELENVNSALIHSNIVPNAYLQNNKLLYTFVPDKDFGQLLVIRPTELIQSRTTDSTFDFIEIWITDQNNSLRLT